ncbi:MULTISPECIES: CatA-like O-acetyltransferase [unclassified Pseudodesulfovibrio]|uniref:CatA-like O-acetyltransferase n=1 Tax=unclassified Pseudodesulfovibrio TaxID=2661612 RepID=UPI000FEC0612|nr:MULTISPECIES: CatA-like O-acetyltransferase [unclassified Pseudodesulfovibrio]MCJ2165096.1 CatA-like O-acetyltransferase [Pseudodesulfovibrio sp. S3-i]RWU03439.1 chloramphenicol acetyltransferase [Pseudodesulfovibrio sp. S3]
MKKIDMTAWPRKSLHDYFRNLSSPHFSLTAEVDVTDLILSAKPRGVSVFNACLYAVMAACNRIPEFRQRFRGRDVVQYDMVHPAPTVPIDGDRFAFCYFDHVPEWEGFNAACSSAIEAGKQQTELKDDSGSRDDLIFTTCLPWVSFTSMHHPVQGPDDSFPRVAWGKFTEHGGRWRMPVNVQVHHALADGLHMGRFYEFMQETLDDFGA